MASSRSAISFRLLTRAAAAASYILVRKDVAFDLDHAGRSAVLFDRRAPCLRGMVVHERVPWLDCFAVEGEPKKGLWSFYKAVEHHGEVGFDAVNEVVEVIGTVAFRHDPV